jgi:hypothetical protein
MKVTEVFPYAAVKSVEDVGVGDRLANLGSVTAVNQVGVFVVFSVLSTAPSLATGSYHERVSDVVRHISERVVTV